MRYLCAVDDCFLDAPAGMARVAWDIALQVRDRGHEVTFFCAAKPGARFEKSVEQVDGMRIIRFERPALSKWNPRRGKALVTAATAAAHQQLGSESFDVLHTHTPVTGLACIEGVPRCVRRVATVHSPAVLEQRINWANQGLPGWLKLAVGQWPMKAMERRLFQRCDAIHTLSRYTRDRLNDLYGVGQKVTVIPHWRRSELRRTHSKEDARRRLGWSEHEKILFTVRGHVPRNGIDVAIRAVAPLAAKGACRFLLAGDGRCRPEYESLARSLNANDRIQFLGRIPDEQLNLAYEAADLFLLPTRALECFGLIILESLAFGCPVLSSDAAAIPETMRPILPDFIVPAGDFEALRGKISDFLEGRLVAKPEQQLVQYTQDHFDISVIVPALIELLFPGARAAANSDSRPSVHVAGPAQ